MGLKPFQLDLRKGMSIDDALQKHNLTLQEALGLVPRTFNKKREKKFRTDNRNIRRNGRHFIIEKKHYGKTKSFGTYDNLKSAQMVRNYLDEHGWDPLDVGLICALLGVERLKVKR